MVHLTQSSAMRGPPRKLHRQRPHIDPVPALERCFADPVLLNVVIATETDDPAIGRLEPRASIGVATNVRAFDGTGEAAWHAAVMLAHPGAMGRALAVIRFTTSLALKPVR